MTGTKYTGVVTNQKLAQWGVKAITHMAEADKWSAEYDRIRRDIEKTPAYKKAEEFNRRKMFKVSWDLQDAAGKHAWHQAEANRLHNAIIAQHALRVLFDQLVLEK